MDLQLVWHKPAELRESAPGSALIYDIDLDRIPETHGVYVFMRRFGDNSNPLYVGKAGNLRARVRQHLDSVKLMKQIQNEANGSRAVVFAEFVPKQGQNKERCISLIEKALIRHFLSDGHDLLNIQGTHIAKHTLRSDKVRGRLLPHKILF